MVYLAEQGLARLAEGGAGVTLDPAWQEMLNHATHRVNQVGNEPTYIHVDCTLLCPVLMAMADTKNKYNTI